jgi:hypothetical protein
VAPLRVKAAGRPVLPLRLAWKPMPTEAFGAIVALYDSFGRTPRR